MKLTNQDREKSYEYSGQELYSIPVLSPKGEIWGFNLHMEGIDELLGTFDSLDEICAEMTAISSTDLPECYISGYSSYNGESDWDMLCKLMRED